MSALPNVIVIGAQKCGTSSLHYYLDLHPEISMSHPASLNFFIDESDCAVPEHSRPLLHPTWANGVDWYRAQFAAGTAVRGEVSPGYTAPWYRGVAERMASVVPEARLIFNVRDPVDRTISHYLHMQAAGRETRDMASALTDPESPYVARSRYHAVLEPFTRCFPAGNILIVDQTELLAQRRKTLAGIYEFVGVDPAFWSEKLERQRHLTAGKGARHALLTRLMGMPTLRWGYRLPQEVKWHVERLASARRAVSAPRAVDEVLRRQLADRLAPDAARFRETAGRAFAHWAV